MKDSDKTGTKDDSTKALAKSETKSAVDRRKQWTKINVEEKTPAPKQDRFEQNRLIKENLFLLAEIDKLKAALNSKSSKSKN